MREVFGAVIATSLALVSVFVPVAFFPGTTGRLYAQFALTIAFAVVLSTFNALTLTPSLSARLLRGGGAHGKGRFFGSIEAVIRRGTDAYVSVLSGLMRVRWVVVALFVVSLGLTGLAYQWVPQSFVPEEDQGWFITIIQAPAGSSLEATSNVAREAERVLMSTPEVRAVFSIVGFSFSGSAPNQGMIFTSLKPFDERQSDEHRLQAVLPRLRGQLFGIQGAMVIPFAPPSINGLGAFGGFTFEVLDLRGADVNQLAAATWGLIGQSARSQRVAGLFSSFTANDPQLTVDIDRDKARSLGLPVSEITSAMQIYLGSAYVNDFDLNNRAYRVYVQADKAFRADPKSLGQYYARTEGGRMVPLANVVRVRETTAPQVISHYNLFRSAEINGGAAPGFSSGQAIDEMEALARRVLPQGFGFSWSGLSLEEIKAGRQSIYIFAIGLLLVYLTLAAQDRVVRPAVHRHAGCAARGARRAHGAGPARPAE